MSGSLLIMKVYTEPEISWLKFNERVNEAANDRNPILERVKFIDFERKISRVHTGTYW